MRVGLVTFDYSPIIGGQGRFAVELADELRKEVELVLFAPTGGERPYESPILRWSRFSRHSHIVFAVAVNALYPRLVRHHRLDCLIISGGPGGAYLLRPLPVPVIVVSHMTYSLPLRFSKTAWWKALFRPLERRSYQNATRVVAVSEGLARELEMEYGTPSERITVIPPPVGEAAFRDQPPLPRSLGEAPKILFLGRVEERKGVFFLLDGWARLVSRAPHHRSLELHVAGEGGARSAAEARARELGISSAVRFLGQIREEEVFSLLDRYDLLIAPSAYEGFGLVAAEALARGLPVVATRVTGLEDVVDASCGSLIEYGDEEALVDAILALLADRERYSLMSASGVRRAEERFRTRAVVGRYLALIASVVGES